MIEYQCKKEKIQKKKENKKNDHFNFFFKYSFNKENYMKKKQNKKRNKEEFKIEKIFLVFFSIK